MPVIFRGSENIAYRDPACYYYNGEYQIKVFTTKAINIHPAENTETT